ncbi:MAG: radical SAM protein [Acidobacteria bacterium]|nr:radical SAM protein [Acidobacteriota bacterium]
MRKLRNDPSLAAADAEGNVFPIPGLFALGRSGGTAVRVAPADYRPLPEGALLFRLPDRRPVGWNPRTARAEVVEEHEGREVFAAAAFLPPAYTHLFLSPWERVGNPSPLPLYAYAALGVAEEGFVAPAVRVDPDTRQDVGLFDEGEIRRQAGLTRDRFPGNRLVEHLVDNCALTYCCPAARNFVLGRWEAPIPTSPACNADCVGCLSLQPSGEVPVTQPRLKFVPTVDEIVEMAVAHLRAAPRPVVSFGQGCEGEPLLRAELLEEAIREIRSRTDRGTINLNSNASRPDAIRRLVAAGLDSLRISINSCRPGLYERYYRPRGYGLDEVVASGRAVSSAGGLVSLNYFMFPGVTDSEDEWAAFERVVEGTGARLVQMRNLNLDPDLYLAALGLPADLAPGFGIGRWMKRVRQRFPAVRFGYFNPAIDR